MVNITHHCVDVNEIPGWKGVPVGTSGDELTAVCFAGAKRHRVHGMAIHPFTARGAPAGDA